MRRAAAILVFAASLVAEPALAQKPRGDADGRCPTRPEVVRLRRNVLARVDRVPSGTVCEEKLEPCTDEGETPALLPSGDFAVALDPDVADDLLADVAPAGRTGAYKGTGSLELGRIEVRYSEYEHAMVSRVFSLGVLQSVNVRWFDTECMCDGRSSERNRAR